MKALLYTTAVVVLLAITSSCCRDDVRLPGIFGDGMVLQRDSEVKIWGWTEKNGEVEVRWMGEKYTATADNEGKWEISLADSPAGGPYTMKVNGISINDIAVGDVILCSGQSNMELPVNRCLDAVGEDIKGYSNEKIRYIKIPLSYSFDGPQEDFRHENTDPAGNREYIQGQWSKLTSDSTALEWGALCYYIARTLQEKNPDIPVGIINSSVGGSPIEAWLPEEYLPEYAAQEYDNLRHKEYIDSIKRKNTAVYSDWQETFEKTRENTDATWKDIDIFDTSWGLDDDGKPYFGNHFIRRHFRLSDRQAEPAPAVIHLGAMVDADSVFINGTFVGNTTYMYPPRNYKIRDGILKEGDNIVDIHLYSYGNAPSFVKDKKYSVELASGEEIPLYEGWEHKKGKRMYRRPDEEFLQYKPVGLFNAMINPVKNYKSRGVVWYQGESNTDNAENYGALLETMINCWRSEMNAPELPFYIVELAAFEHSELTDYDFGWNRIQKEQRRTAERMDGVKLVPNRDIGEWNDIHPQDKKTVGERVVKAMESD